MPLFANLLYSFFAGIVAWLAKYLTQKVAVTLSIVSILSIIYVAFYVAFRSLMNAAFSGAYSFSPMFGAGIAVVIPPRSANLLASYLVFWAACELFKWKFSIVQLWSRTI